MKISNYITLVKDSWSVEEVVEDFVKRHRDGQEEIAEVPFHVVDLGEVVRRHEVWERLMPRVEPFYAVKCNNDQMVVRTLAALGAGFDCATKQELDLVMGCGVHPDRIIYAHTAKMASHMRHAMRLGVTTTCYDSKEELIKIKQYMPDARLVLRIRCDATVSHVNLGNKFGCDPVTDAPALLREAVAMGLQVVGVSFHVGSGAEEFEAYARGIQYCAALFKEAQDFGLQLQVLDIGGGFLGQLGSSLAEVAVVVNKALEKYFPDESVRVIAEPGQYFVCAASTVAACIIATRQVTKNNEPHTMYYISDGVFGSFVECIYPGSTDVTFTAQPIPKSDGVPVSSSVWGPTCDGVDCVLRSTLLPPLPVGSWLLFRDMGAYSTCLATNFHGLPKPCVFYVVEMSIGSILKKLELFSDVDFESRLVTLNGDHK